METLRWDNFCNFGATLLGFGTLFTNIILLWIRNFEKNRTTPTPKKTQKTPKKRLMDFHDGITCQCFELEGWDLVQCLLISFCFGSKILKKIGPPQPPKKTKKKPKKDMDFHDGITCQRFELEGWDVVQCLLISFCFGSEILKKIGPPHPPKKNKKTQKKTYGFSRWDNFATL